MDKRIIDLKKQIIKENVDKIMSLSKTGVIEFTLEDNLKMLDDMKSETNFITRIWTNGNSVFISAYFGDKIFDNDAEFMDLEEMDYNISSILDNLIKNK